MKNILKSRLTIHNGLKESGYSGISVVDEGNLCMEDIVSEMQKDGLNMDREAVLEILKQFNLKVAQKVLSGYRVDTGLLKMKPEVKGFVYNGKWNPSINRIEVSFASGKDLLNEISETKVEIMENDKMNNKTSDVNASDRNTNNSTLRVKDRYLHIDNDVPACGVAFRRWLCKA